LSQCREQVNSASKYPSAAWSFECPRIVLKPNRQYTPTPFFSPPSSLRQGYDRQAGPARRRVQGLHRKSKFLAAIRFVTWIDANAPFYGTHQGKKNIKWKDDPDFRPMP